jgi:Domain of unknown function (DUF5916)
MALGCVFIAGASAQAQTAGVSPETRTPAALAAPVPPAVIVRDDEGHVTLRAVRLPAPIRLDGVLDEEVYASTPAISGFIQNDPAPGQPSTEKTEVWVMFDRNTFYVTARCWDTHPERLIANEMRRDSPNVVQNDAFAFALDTFHDRRNAVMFEMNAIGGRIDGQVTNERQVNLDWNPVWRLQVGRFDGGWTVEAAIPFKSLRYGSGRSQVWGFNARRIIRWKNEVSYINRIPAAMTLRGHFQSSLMPTLVGIEAPPANLNVELKPWAISSLTTDRVAATPLSNDLNGDLGVDAKLTISQSLTGDFTVNTDFAQVEADEQQVNLTRFSLFFPEKRDFFLENQGTFAFGGAAAFGGAGGAGGGGGPQSGGASAGNANDTPILFYSRRVGLSQNGQAVPIDAGARVTGRFGRYSLGLINIQSGDHRPSNSQSTNFTSLRVRRDFLRKSTLGAIYNLRSIAQNGVGRNETYGADGTFAFYDNLTINTYWARTSSADRVGDDRSHRAQLDYTGDRYGVQAEHLMVGKNFNPELGFVRRANMERSYGQFRFSPRTRRYPSIRRVFSQGSYAYIRNRQGRVETRDADAELAVEYQNGDRPFVAYSNTYEFLPQPFAISSGVTLASKGYQFASTRVGMQLGQQRRIAGVFSVEHGSFYNGDKTSWAWARGRAFITPQLSVEPRVSLDRVKLVEGSFTSTVVGTRATFTATPLMFVSALVQYASASHALSANVRLRWEYTPGSELFVVWNESRDTLLGSFPELANRALIIKVNRLLRF